MNKIALPLVGISGLGASSVGGYLLFRNKWNETPYVKKENTFRNRYSQATLEEESELWESKFNSFQNGATPTHPTLIKAKNQVTTKAQNAKDLHKLGCKEIYESEIHNSPYFQDFKSYCSRTIKDGMGSTKNWISAGKEDGSKWNPKLTNLKTHKTEDHHTLDSTLENLKNSLTGTDANWDNEKREALKNWCDGIQKEIFMGDKSPEFIHAGLYCV
ncbi:hypothetical protein MHC_03185 [Mycoplasma haemocanis str. Illinois]|uniref:Uncharacterized protein n=1 Tax=Mycoplasma haemocanis (strain Illinois) TaxID=1111676 RepID=H6N775_MYCHN|nr:hypothetical protein [Mycoplasma haemocanis]AEW45497.1 hypothetical protein MHC_03185 [Mycoplasma haemocanis str. Illinois]